DEYVYFALAMDLDFYIPQDGKVDGKEIVFNFNGDDDMWVFVDGELALDIGGAHTDVKGYINFTTGETYVDNVRGLTDSTTTGNGSKTDKLSSGQYTPGEYHKLKIFYMERAGTNSNCLIQFNLPVVPTGDVIVEKQVVEENGNAMTEDLSFNFEAKVDGELFANKSFTIATKDANGNVIKTENAATDARGIFSLKHNQMATFGGVDEGKEVTIREIQPTSTENSIYRSTTLNGENVLQKTYTTSAGSILSYKFVNTYAALTDIVIEKTVSGLDFAELPDETQTFLFRVKGNDAHTKHIDLTVAIDISPEDLKNAVLKDSITIKNVPIGSYTVTEDTNWPWRYEADSMTVITKTVKPSDNTFSFANTRENPYWLSGDCYCKNWWETKTSIKKESDDEEA
ncbi:MAG: fibro-slime domain-containing protein, partial [Christensenellaceae bacterium]|nr:fibro-slime domain-containing protein [Christensenellaceae bacterium]